MNENETEEEFNNKVKNAIAELDDELFRRRKKVDEALSAIEEAVLDFEAMTAQKMNLIDYLKGIYPLEKKVEIRTFLLTNKREAVDKVRYVKMLVGDIKEKIYDNSKLE
jgi:hypothetical protein